MTELKPQECMTYIPLLETLSVLLSCDIVQTEVWTCSQLHITSFVMIFQIERGHSSPDPSFLRDYCDGSHFKYHPLLYVHVRGLQILLYK